MKSIAAIMWRDSCVLNQAINNRYIHFTKPRFITWKNGWSRVANHLLPASMMTFVLLRGIFRYLQLKHRRASPLKQLKVIDYSVSRCRGTTLVEGWST